MSFSSTLPAATVSKAPAIIPSFILTKQQLVPAKKISPPVRSLSRSTSNESTSDTKGKPSVIDTPRSSKSPNLLPESVSSSPSSVSARQAKSPSSSLGRHAGGGNHRHGQGRVREPFLGASALSGQHHQMVWKTVSSSLPSPKKPETEGEHRVKSARKTSSSLTPVATTRDEQTDKGRASPSPEQGGEPSREVKGQEREEEDNLKGRFSSSGKKKKKESSVHHELPPDSEGRREEETTKRERRDLVDGSGSLDRSAEGKVPSDIQASAPDGVHAITQTYKSKSETKGNKTRSFRGGLLEEELYMQTVDLHTRSSG